MSMERWELAKRQEGNIAAAEVARVLREQFGDVPLPTLGASQTVKGPRRRRSANETASTASTETALTKEYQRQVDAFVRLGFHEALNMTEVDYRASLPSFTPQPETFKGRFDIPLLVDARIRVPDQATRAGVVYYLDGLNVRDWEEDPKGYVTPKTAYTTWVQDGSKNLKRSMRDVRMTLDPDERGATEMDGIALYIVHPEILKDHFIDLPGTSVESVDAAYLDVWDGKPRLGRRHVDLPLSRFGAVSCGRN